MDYMALGRRVRKRRKEMRLTQEMLAEKAAISPSFLGHIERGSRILSLDTLLRLCEALETTANDLLGAFEDGPQLFFPPEWSSEQCAAVQELLEAANSITKRMKSFKNSCKNSSISL